VAGVVGVGGSPSCGVRQTLELSGAVEAMAACPLAAMDRAAFNRDVIAANLVAGEGLFVHELRRALRRRGVQVPFDEHDLDLDPGGHTAAAATSQTGSGTRASGAVSAAESNRLPDQPGRGCTGCGDQPMSGKTGGPRETGPAAAS
jgi:hypothetical protein